MASPDRFSSDPSRCRRHCRTCGRWRYWTDFGVRSWADADKTIPRYLRSDCRTCTNRLGREWWAGASSRDRSRRVASSRVAHRAKRRREGRPEVGPRVLGRRRKGTVERLPLAEYLRSRLHLYDDKQHLARVCGVDEAYLRRIMTGVSWSTYSGGLKRYAMDWVDLGTADRILTNEGGATLDDLYPVEP